MKLLSLAPPLNRILLSTALLSAVIALPAPTSLVAQVRLEIVPLKQADTYLRDAFSINNHGQVVGQLNNATALWQRDTAIRLLFSPGLLYPRRINDSGTIIGERGHHIQEEDVFPYYSEAYLWNETTGHRYISTEQLHESGTLPLTRPTGLSNTGFAVGSSTRLGTNGTHLVTKGWIWSDRDGLTEIPRLAHGFGYETTEPSAVNDSGGVVGTYGYDFTEEGSRSGAGFLYDAANGTRALQDIDRSFFNHNGVQPNDINNSSVIVGVISSFGEYAFIYDLDARSGTTFNGFGSDQTTFRPAGAHATSINDLGITVGIAEDMERAPPGEERYVPFIWSPETSRATRLMDHTTTPFESLLPEGHDIEDAFYAMRSINDHGQMLGSVYNYADPNSNYEVPFALYPILDYQFQLQGKVAGPEGDRLVFAHSKHLDEGSLTPSHFGKTVVHESSADGKTWQPLEHGVNGVEILDGADELQILVPAQPKVFLRSRLADPPTSSD